MHIEKNEKATLLFAENTASLEANFYKYIEEYVNTFDTQKGFLVSGDANVEKLAGLQKEIEKTLGKVGYDKVLGDLLKNLDDINEFWIQFHLDENEIVVKPIPLTKVQEAYAAMTVQGAGIKGIANGLQPILHRALINNITLGTSLTETLKQVKQSIVSGETTSQTTRYITTATRDVLFQYDGAVNETIAKAYGLDGWKYVGSVVDKTRPQCKRWLKMGTIAGDELAKEIKWAKENGSGLNPDTTPTNFGVYRGGYGCRHSAYPVRLKK